MEAEICKYIYIYIYIYTERERETSLEKQETRGRRNLIVHNTIAGTFYTTVQVEKVINQNVSIYIYIYIYI